MIAWLAPAAFAALGLLAGPMVVHLLARRSARRVLFPATAFVRATQAAAIKIRRPSDIGLLLVRLGIVAAAVLAAAQPLLLARWRLAAWNTRISRAVILDTATEAGDAARLLADQEAGSAFRSVRIDAGDLGDALARASPWLDSTPPSRREVVVVSDFRRGAIERSAFDALPADAGIRFIRAGVAPQERTATLGVIDGFRGGQWQPVVSVDASGTRTRWTRTADRGGAANSAGWLTVAAAPADAGAAERARRAAASFGVAGGDDTHRAAVVFAGGADPAGAARAIHIPWMAAAARALRDSDLLREIEVEVAAEDRGGVLVVRAPMAASAPDAPAVMRAVILALRPAAIAGRGLETLTLPDSTLAEWRRDPGPVTELLPRWRGTDIDSDGRWLWGLALGLLGVEGWMRRRHAQSVPQETHVRAA